VDGDHELFWALRGGGGRFAIVTALELDAHPLEGVFAGLAAWPAERAPEVLEEFRRWSFEAPEALTPIFRYLALPPIEAIPEPLRGRKVVALLAAYLGTEADGARLTAPIRAADGKLMDTFGMIAPAGLVRVAGDPEDPVPARGDGFMLDELSENAVEAIGGLIAEDALDPLTVLELRLLGGALARPADGHGALPRLEGGFSVFASGAVVDSGAAAAIAARVATVRDRLRPWTTPRALLNSSGGGIDPATAFDASTWDRLERVRDAWDPGRLIQPNHE
jgi:hypothetical protein